MSFAAGPDAYDRFMAWYSVPLAPGFADFASIEAPQLVLDVGCGPGALDERLARRVGAHAVTAVDPSPGFVEAAQERNPDVAVRQAEAEQLPFDDESFDAALAQLVVHFMAEPIAGLREMRRVTRSGGVVAACVWDHAGGSGPIARFWETAHELDPDVRDESRASRRAPGRPRAAVPGGRPWRCRGAPADRRGRAPDVRGVVGAVHPRHRGRGVVRGGAHARVARPAARSLSRAPPAPSVRRRGERLGGARGSLRQRLC